MGLSGNTSSELVSKLELERASVLVNQILPMSHRANVSGSGVEQVINDRGNIHSFGQALREQNCIHDCVLFRVIAGHHHARTAGLQFQSREKDLMDYGKKEVQSPEVPRRISIPGLWRIFIRNRVSVT